VRALAEADLASLPARELKRQLVERGVDVSNIFEKGDLVKLLAKSASSPAGVPLLRYGTPREYGGVITADSKLYRGLAVQLKELGTSLPFVIDTASSSCLIAPALAAKLGRASTGATVSVNSATGSSAGLRQVRLGSASIGGVPCGALDAVVMELPLEDKELGMLGLDVLMRLDLDLRFAEGVAVPYPLGKFSARAATDGSLRAVRCAVRQLAGAGLLTCLAMLSTPGGIPVAVSAIVDTGSPVTIANWAAATAAGITAQSVRYGNEALVGPYGEPIRTAEIDALLQLGDGPSDPAPLSLSVADAPVFEALGVGRKPFMIVGLDALGSDRLVLSAGTGMMWMAQKRA
jgi:hypothetical protein